MIYNHDENTLFVTKNTYADLLSKDQRDDLYKYFLGLREIDSFIKLLYKPDTLFIEPHNNCQLRCSYCYADVKNCSPERMSVEEFEELNNKFKFKNISIFGGDFFSNWEYAKTLISKFGYKESISISTNGIGLTKDRLAILREHCRYLSIQISLEPKSWNKRLAGSGKHQNDLLKDVDLSFLDNISVAVTIPKDGLDNWSKSIYPYIQEFNEILHRDDYLCTWKMEAGDINKEINPWTSSWLNETLFEIDGGFVGERFVRQSLLSNKLMFFKNLFKGSSYFPAAMFNCNAGFGSISIGPNNKLYTCHEMAILKNDKFSVDLSLRSLFKTSKNNINMNNKTCASCSSRYTCGGICLVFSGDQRCEYERIIQKLTLKAIDSIYPAEVIQFSRVQKAFLENFVNTHSSIKPILESDIWKKLVCGELPVEEVAALVKSFVGISVDLDTPLWELPESQPIQPT